ncbi:MAG: diaminopimelate epimerase [Ferruginibacter sp.]|nr:diaminopimelate epimerase [Ferruginibacter sp.]
MQITFYKYQGTGNDFIIIDCRDIDKNLFTTQIIKKLCDRKFGIGADGLILLNNKKGYDFEMIYYNADGNQSTMCGNGGRCIVQFANDIGIHKAKYNFLAIDGAHEAEINEENLIRLKMQDVDEVETNATHSILNTGSPHYVQLCNNVKQINVDKEGAEIRYSKAFEKNGINVNFVENIGSYSIYVRTYERGVEAETLSCGTGVTAAALISAHNERGFNEIHVQTIGGSLNVDFTKTADKNFRNIYLCGAATFVFKGSVNI